MKTLLVAALVTLATGSAAFAGPAFVCSMTNRRDTGDRMDMTFSITDAEGKKGMLIGNAGTADLLVTRGVYTINFFEFTDAGNVMLATVAVPSELPLTSLTPISYSVVYSRHTAMIAADGTTGSDLIPSQYLGECTLKN